MRAVIAEYGGLGVPIAELADDDDLYRAGLTAHRTASVLVEVEREFGVRFSADLVCAATFRSVAALGATVERLLDPATD